MLLTKFSVGRPSKRKRSPRRDSPKRGFRTRRVSLPMQQHPGFEPCVLAKAKVWLPVDVIEEVILLHRCMKCNVCVCLFFSVIN